MSDDAKMLAASSLAAAIFTRVKLEPDQDPVKAMMSLYKKVFRRLNAANIALDAEEAAIRTESNGSVQGG